MSILVLSHEHDGHSKAVLSALQDCEADVTRLSGADFPVRDTLSIGLGAGHQKLLLESSSGETFDLTAVTTVWRRRGEFPQIDADAIHPEDRKFAHAEAEAAANGLRDVSALLNHAAWVNPRQQAVQAQNKPYQLARALQNDLEIPKTLVSNSPDEIRAFYNAASKRVIYKPLTPAAWAEDGESFAYFVEELAEEAVAEDELLKLTPGIYQAYVDKAFELRVTIMDRFVYAVKIDSQALKAAETDWRQNIDQLAIEPYELPPRVEGQLLSLMASLGLRFGAIDLIVTPNGAHVFLEVNEMGQFLWIDQRLTRAKLLAHFCAFLSCAERPYSGSLGGFEHVSFDKYGGQSA